MRTRLNLSELSRPWRSLRLLLAASLFSILCASKVQAQVQGDWFVDATAPGTQSGLDWTNAFHTLEAALAAASPDQTILLSEGLYTPQSQGGAPRTETFNITNPVRIYGGYVGYNGGTPGTMSVDLPDGNRFNTHLSGDVAGTPLNPGDDAYHVVTISFLGLSSPVRLDGLRISNGFADGTGQDSIGGGILLNESWLLMSDAFLRENFAAGNGGGIHVSGTSILHMKKSRIRRNQCGADGAGIYVEGNTEATLFNLQMSQNRSSARGGGLRFNSTGEGKLLIANSVLFDNRAALGGAISMNANTAGRDIVNCTIALNSAGAGGSAGAGIHVDVGTNQVRLLNSIVYHNPYPANNDNVWTATPGSFIVDHSDLGAPQPGVVVSAENIDLLPLFRNIPGRNLQLQAASPCLEAGNDNYLLIPAHDVLDIDEDGDSAEKLDRDIRIVTPNGPSDREQLTANPATTFGVDDPVFPPFGVIVDMGAYEQFFPGDPGSGGGP